MDKDRGVLQKSEEIGHGYEDLGRYKKLITS